MTSSWFQWSSEWFANISGCLQLGLMIWMLFDARSVARQYRVGSWATIWIFFAIGFTGMLESRIFVLLSAAEIENRYTLFIRTFMTPLQATIGLWAGMRLMTQLMRSSNAITQRFHLPPKANLVLDPDSKIVYWDAGAEEFYGWKAKEALGKHFTELTSPQRLRLPISSPVLERYKLDPRRPHSQVYPVTAIYHGDDSDEFWTEVVIAEELDKTGKSYFTLAARRLVSIT